MRNTVGTPLAQHTEISRLQLLALQRLYTSHTLSPSEGILLNFVQGGEGHLLAGSANHTRSLPCKEADIGIPLNRTCLSCPQTPKRRDVRGCLRNAPCGLSGSRFEGHPYVVLRRTPQNDLLMPLILGEAAISGGSRISLCSRWEGGGYRVCMSVCRMVQACTVLIVLEI